QTNLLPASSWVVVVGYEDKREAVPWQAQQLIKEAPAGLCRDLDVGVGAAAEAFWPHLTEFPAWTEGPLTFKANLLPRGVADLCHRLEARSDGLLIQAHAANGIVIGHALDTLT